MKIIEYLLVVFAILYTSYGFAMQVQTVSSGQGYLSWNGQRIADYVLNNGSYTVCNGVTQVEVDSGQNMNAQLVNSAAYFQFFNTVGCN